MDEATEVAHLKELYHRNDPEAVIRLFESQPSLHSNPSAVAEYVKALVKVDRLDDSELVKTLQRGGSCIRVSCSFCGGLDYFNLLPFFPRALVFHCFCSTVAFLFFSFSFRN